MTVTSREGETGRPSDHGRISGSVNLSVFSSQSILFTVVAVVCGALAASAVTAANNWLLTLAMALVLALASVAVWSVIAGVNWSEPLVGWRRWTRSAPVRALPYTQPGSDAAQLAQNFSQLKSWLHDELVPQHGGALLIGAAGLFVAAVLSAALGAQAVLLSIAALSLAQVAAVLCRGNGRPNVVLQSVLVAGVPMLLGYAVFKPLSPYILLAALGVAIAFASLQRRSPLLRNAGYALLLLTLVALRQPLGAFIIAVMWAPQLILNFQRGSSAWLIAGMLVFAVATAGV